MGGQNGPQTYADVLRHPQHSATAYRLSADDTTSNQTTTSHCWFGRSGREGHNCKANKDEGSPRLQPPTHILTLVMLTLHISTNDLHCCKHSTHLCWMCLRTCRTASCFSQGDLTNCKKVHLWAVIPVMLEHGCRISVMTVYSTTLDQVNLPASSKTHCWDSNGCVTRTHARTRA